MLIVSLFSVLVSILEGKIGPFTCLRSLIQSFYFYLQLRPRFSSTHVLLVMNEA